MAATAGEKEDPERGGGKQLDPERGGLEDADPERSAVDGEDLARGRGAKDDDPEGGSVEGEDRACGRGAKDEDLARGRRAKDDDPDRRSVEGDDLARGCGAKDDDPEGADLARGRSGKDDLAPGKVVDKWTKSRSDDRPSFSDPFSDIPEFVMPSAEVNPQFRHRMLSLLADSVGPLRRATPVAKEALKEAYHIVCREVLADTLLGNRDLSEFSKRIPNWLESIFAKPRPKPGPKPDQPFRYLLTDGPAAARAGKPYHLLTRAEVKTLQQELKEAADAFKEGSKYFKASAHDFRAEQHNLRRLIEQYSEAVKAGLDHEAAILNISTESAAELKVLVDEIKHAFQSANAGYMRFNLTNFEKFVQSTGLNACKDLMILAVVVRGLQDALASIKFEAAPFDPKETKAGKLLYDDYTFGLKLKCISTAGCDRITTLLSGDINALQSQVMVRRIQDNWSCELGVGPGNELSVKAAVEDMWVKGLKFDLNFPIFDGPQRKVEIMKKHMFGSAGGSLGLNANPLLSLNFKFGTKQLSGGLMVDYDTRPGFLRRAAVCGVFDIFGLSGSLLMEKIIDHQAGGQQQQPPQPAAGGQQQQPPQPAAAGQQQPPQPAVVRHQITGTAHLKASEATAVAVEVSHRLEAMETTIALGVEHTVDSTTAVKCKLTNQWHLTALMQHKVGDNGLLSLSGMVDIGDLGAQPRLGLSFSFAS